MSWSAQIRIALRAGERFERMSAELFHWTRRPGRVLFDHIPKSGGSTIRTFLKRNFPKRFTFCTQPDYLISAQEFAEWSEARCFSYRLVMGHYTHLLIEKVHPDSVITTVLREPIDAVVSLYYYGLQEHAKLNNPILTRDRFSLADFAEGAFKMKVVNRVTQHFTGLSPSEIDQDPDAAVDRAFKFVEAHYRIVGFQDDLASFGAQVALAARLWRPLGQLRVNVTKKRLALSEIADSDRAHIEQVNATDIKLYQRLRERWAPVGSESQSLTH